MQIYTIGYQGLSTEAYSQALINAGVSLVIDVRENPWSQRTEYIGAILKRRLALAGIDYEHWRSLGNPAANRKTATSASQCLTRYRDHLAQENDQILQMLTDKLAHEWSNDRKICLTCYEHQHTDCHRSVIIEEISRIRPGIISIHLAPEIVRAKRKAPKPNSSSLVTTSIS